MFIDVNIIRYNVKIHPCLIAITRAFEFSSWIAALQLATVFEALFPTEKFK